MNYSSTLCDIAITSYSIIDFFHSLAEPTVTLDQLCQALNTTSDIVLAHTALLSAAGILEPKSLPRPEFETLTQPGWALAEAHYNEPARIAFHTTVKRPDLNTFVASED